MPAWLFFISFDNGTLENLFPHPTLFFFFFPTGLGLMPALWRALSVLWYRFKNRSLAERKYTDQTLHPHQQAFWFFFWFQNHKPFLPATQFLLQNNKGRVSDIPPLPKLCYGPSPVSTSPPSCNCLNHAGNVKNKDGVGKTPRNRNRGMLWAVWSRSSGGNCFFMFKGIEIQGFVEASVSAEMFFWHFQALCSPRGWLLRNGMFGK